MGGAFSPGIEVTWISRDPRIYSEPFRIRAGMDVTAPLSLGQDFSRGLEPGDSCKYMALPWQADFNECSGELVGHRFAYWWPVQRPDYVYDRARRAPAASALDRLGQRPERPDYLEFADDTDMVRHWSQLGFVYRAGAGGRAPFLEVGRTLPRPPE